MIRKVIKHFWNLRREFAKYFIIGISAFVADIGSLYILKEHFHLSATVAVILNQPIITACVFYANKKWSFRAGGLTHKQMIRFYILAAFNYGFSIIWIYSMHDLFGVQYIVARVMNIMLAVLWNFLLYKHWVYRESAENLHEQAKNGQIPPQNGGAGV
jgi:putative flippase GtrA